MNKHKKIISLILVSMFILSSSVFASENAIIPFNDVPENHWAYKDINELRSLEITNGIGDNQFGLGLTIKRSEFVTFLVKLMQWDLITPEKGSYVDNVDTSKWYYAPIETALKHGVISNDIESFRVDEPITREEMAIMIVRTLEYDNLANQLTYLESPFNDVSQNIGYINIAKDFGIINGVGNNSFKPYDTAKREEAAAMMMRMYNKLNSSINALHAFYAISSANQANLIPSLDSVGFGWSRLEYDDENNQVVLNTTRDNNNEYAIPNGFQEPLTLAKNNSVSTQLMVFLKNDTVYDSNTNSNVPLFEYILTKPEIRKQVIDSIVSQVNSTNVADISASFNGVVIDFENMKGELLKQSFNIFLTELNQELDKNNNLLYVAVHPARRTGQAYYDGYDYKAIGEIADKVILMAHDYYARELTTTEMENEYTTTPLTPIDEIYYALKSITDKDSGVQDSNKIYLQISFDAVQWKIKDGKVINKYPYNPSYDAIQKRLTMDNVTINYSEQIQNPYASFYDSNDETNNIIWYEDSRSMQAKIDLAKMFDVHGISLWRLGNIPAYEESETKNFSLDVWQQILANTEK